MTDDGIIFDLLEDQTGQKYLYVHTGDAMQLVKVDIDDIVELREILDESPTRISGLGVVENNDH
jgi:hypothetical protein